MIGQNDPIPMHAITTSSGKRFEAKADEALLDAGARQGIVLAYSCRTGRCSTCKAQVRSGSSLASHEELGLTAAERASGWILTCVRQATSDMALAVEDLGDVELFPAKTLPCRIQSIELLASDVVKVILRLPPTASFNYHPGQYIDVIGNHGLRRSYSVANAPSADKMIELHIRAVEAGAMSQYWFEQAKANDLLRLNGPLGTFFLRDAAGKDLALLATGTGIAPLKAMLEGIAKMPRERLPRSISVYWGGRVPQDIYWNLAELDVPIRFIPVLSRAGGEWSGARGHVQDALLADQPTLAQAVVYACGSDSMIHSARARLTEAGLAEGHFHSDAFVCSASN